MHAAIDLTRRWRTSDERAHLTFWSMGAGRDDHAWDASIPGSAPIQERIRRIPEALLLTAGYYASRVPPLNELLRRLD